MKKSLILLFGVLLFINIVSATNFTTNLIDAWKFEDNLDNSINVSRYLTSNVGINNYSLGISGKSVNSTFKPTELSGLYNTNNIIATGNFSINAWFRINTSSAGNSVIYNSYSTSRGIQILRHTNHFYADVEDGGAMELEATNCTITHDQWYMTTLVKNASFLGLYVNGTLCSWTTHAIGDISGGQVPLTKNYGGVYTIGLIDEVYVWRDRVLTQAEIIELKSCFYGMDCFNSVNTTSDTNFTIKAYDNFNYPIMGFNVTINGSLNYYTSSNTLVTDIYTNTTNLINILVFKEGYYNNYTTNVNTSQTFNVTLEIMTPYSVNITNPLNNSNNSYSINITYQNATTIIGNISYYNISLLNNDSSFNQTIKENNGLNNSYYWLIPNNLTVSNYIISVKAITTNNLSNYSLTYINIQNYVNITAYDIILSSKIQNFTIFVNGINYTTNNYFIMVSLDNGLQQLIFNTSIYALSYYNLTLNTSSSTSLNNTYEFLVYGNNSIRFYIRDETTGLFINNTNVSIKFTYSLGEFTNSTDTGYFYIQDLYLDTYTLLFSANGYNSRTYTITITNRSTQELTVYLPSNASTTILTVSDCDSATPLEDVLLSIYKSINSSWVVVESKSTDITGRTQITYISNTNYKFYLSKAGYEDLIFYLNPILFSSYDVALCQVTLENSTSDYERVSIIYGPTLFYNNQQNNFTFIINSPYGELINYGFNVSYFKFGSYNYTSASGVNAIGSQLTGSFNISNTDSFDVVKVTYYYTTSLSGLRTFTYYYPIIITQISNTSMANKDKTYGLGIFERILIVTLIVLLAVGVSALVGQIIPGMAIGLLLYGYFCFIGFIPLWIVLPSFAIGILILGLKS